MSLAHSQEGILQLQGMSLCLFHRLLSILRTRPRGFLPARSGVAQLVPQLACIRHCMLSEGDEGTDPVS